jgi:hypothetical protein
VTSKSKLNDDSVITDEFDAETAGERCSYRIVQVHEAVRNAAEGKWDAPNFQRGFIWKPRQLRDLADSQYRDYPIGSLLLWEDPAARSKYWIADGQHRLVSLCLLFGATPFWWRSTHAKPYDYVSPSTLVRQIRFTRHLSPPMRPMRRARGSFDSRNCLTSTWAPREDGEISTKS